MNVLIASMSNLFLEAFQLAINNRRPCWNVSIHLIQTPSFKRSLEQKIIDQHIDIVVIEITDYQHFSMTINNLKEVTVEGVNGVLLVDSKAGEVYHHLKNEERWIGILKNTSLDEFIALLEAFKCNTPTDSITYLTELDKNVLKGLANGQTLEFLQHTHDLTLEGIEQSIFRINSYFKAPNYIESICKAIEHKVITI